MTTKSPRRAQATRTNCAMWLTPEQIEQAHQRHLAAGRKLVGTIPCVCGNHERRMYS